MSPKRSADGLNRNLVELDGRTLSAHATRWVHRVECFISPTHRFLAFKAKPFPVSRLRSISIFAPSRPCGLSPDCTSLRTKLIASSALAGSPSNVATRAYMSLLPSRGRGEHTQAKVSLGLR